MLLIITTFSLKFFLIFITSYRELYPIVINKTELNIKYAFSFLYVTMRSKGSQQVVLISKVYTVYKSIEMMNLNYLLKFNPFPPRLQTYFILCSYFYNEFINK